MHVSPAAAAAGSVVLPHHIVFHNPQLSYTEPTEGLEPDASFLGKHRDDRRFLVIGLDQSGKLYVIYKCTPGIQHLDHEFSSRGWREGHEGHVLRTLHSEELDSVHEALVFIDGRDRHPWLRHNWFRANFRRWVELLPVPSKTQPGRLAYYTSSAKRAARRETPIKAGRWLQKYFGDILTQEQIKEHALEWEAACGPVDVHITQDADEIEAVYRSNHNGSCMWFGDTSYRGSCHPARVYAGPDLGIAYIGTTDDAKGRCLVWREKKIFFYKTYGDGDRLKSALVTAGYTEAGSDAFTGARLQRIPYEDRYVMPYVDTHEAATDDGEFVILDDDGEIGCRSSDHIRGLSYPTYNRRREAA
ncbi:hypothetical protein [Ensifer soli]|uniref:hypothetical protein n=1 Tax=Ciceribacter sp. sgz301302 TaxID=3342379 RepID=UPI0035B8639A